MSIIRIYIPGTPVGCPRPKVTRNRGVFYPGRYAEYLKALQWQAKVEFGTRKKLAGPVSVRVLAQFTPPRSWPKYKREAATTARQYHTARPDLDNIVKAALDGLAPILENDWQVANLFSAKFYGPKPGLEIQVCELEAAE